jgi:hypothetical protein
MPTPSFIISQVAALMNDAAQSSYTNEACLPYLNMAMRQLQEIFQLNNVPVTDRTSTSITVPADTSSIGYKDGPPQLPADLLTIETLWESPSGENNWIPMTLKNFLPHYLEDVQINQFLVWAWTGDAIKVIPANTDIDLKIDYVRNLFNLPVKIEQVDINLPEQLTELYLQYKTGALCANYIGENPTRAESLEVEAELAKDRALGIQNKPGQGIMTRHRPFRGSYKSRGWF